MAAFIDGPDLVWLGMCQCSYKITYTYPTHAKLHLVEMEEEITDWRDLVCHHVLGECPQGAGITQHG